MCASLSVDFKPSDTRRDKGGKNFGDERGGEAALKGGIRGERHAQKKKKPSADAQTLQLQTMCVKRDVGQECAERGKGKQVISVPALCNTNVSQGHGKHIT